MSKAANLTRACTLPVASGGAPYDELSKKMIRLIKHGCANRPFYHIAVQEMHILPDGPVIEQLGTYDPLPNMYNEKLVSMNFARIQHWLDKGAGMSIAVKRLLGLAGYLPVHPQSYRFAWLQRKLIMDKLTELESKLPDKSGSPTELDEK